MLQQQSGRMIGDYEIIRPLGRGGMAEVFLARDVALGREVALKVLDPLRSDDREWTARFLYEQRLALTLNHPNIVTTYKTFEHDGRPYIAMEYVAGGSLRPQVGRLSLPQIGVVLEGILDALAYAHAQRIVHRDLKPQNVLVSDSRGIKLVDFGIAKALDSAGNAGFETRVGSVYGTPAYMAPEQIAGETSPRSDLYAVGCMAYELLTGRLPYGDESNTTAGRILRGHLAGGHPKVRELAPSVDPRVNDWVEQMMAIEPEDRPATADEAFRLLEDVILAVEDPTWRRRAQLRPEPAETPATSTHLTGFVRFDDDGGCSFERVGEQNGTAAPVSGTSQELRRHAPPDEQPPHGLPPEVLDAPRGPRFARNGAQPTFQPEPEPEPTPTPVAPAPAAPSRSRRGLRWGLAAGAATIVAGGAAAFFVLSAPEPAPLVDVRPAEAKIREVVEFQQPVKSVRCPREVPRQPGVRFACDVALEGTDQRLWAIVTPKPGEEPSVQLQLRPRS
jgi:serine/threonine protein kinase